MTFEKLLSNINHNIKKIVEELRERIKEIPETSEVIDKRQIIYQHYGKEFCTIKIKKDHLEIDFIVDNTVEDPMEFSWKIKPTIKCDFNRRMQTKNIADIDIVFGLIFQSCNTVNYPRLKAAACSSEYDARVN
jgi:vacuolar-type H+-ATPase subunit E/Vma4